MGQEKLMSTYKADLLEDLKDPEYALAYVESALQSDSSDEFPSALRDIAEAHQMSSVAKSANLNRENLYKMLSKSGTPRLDSLKAVLRSVGLKLEIGLLEPPSRPRRSRNSN
jgi:probable addiction module antidote protein